MQEILENQPFEEEDRIVNLFEKMIELTKNTYLMEEESFLREWTINLNSTSIPAAAFTLIQQNKDSIEAFICSETLKLSNKSLIDINYKIILSQASKSGSPSTFYVSLTLKLAKGKEIQSTTLNLSLRQFYSLLSKFEQIDSVLSTVS